MALVNYLPIFAMARHYEHWQIVRLLGFIQVGHRPSDERQSLLHQMNKFIVENFPSKAH